MFEFSVCVELRAKIKDCVVTNNTKGTFEQINRETEIVHWKNKTISKKKMNIVIYDILEQKFSDGKVDDLFHKITFG
jgi:hypothetical protein